jgi:hypothetical protein
VVYFPFGAIDFFSKTAQVPTQPPVPRLPRALFLRANLPVGKADRSHPPSAEAKNEGSYTSSPPICLHGVVGAPLPMFDFYLYTFLLKPDSPWRTFYDALRNARSI